MLRLAYLVSRYPAVSHTFILREVLELRKLGIEVLPMSINPPDRVLETLTAEERSEAERTFVVKQQSSWRLLMAFLQTLVQRPLALLSGIGLAMGLSAWDLRALFLRLCYLAEAVAIGDQMRRLKLNHLHVHFATPAATVALFVRKVFGHPFSLTVHGPDEFYSVDEYHLRHKIETASFLCCIGSYCRSQLMKLSTPEHWSKFEISPLGVDPSRFAARSKSPGKEKFVILCVGRLVPAKGQAVLLSAVELLRKRGRNVEVISPGTGLTERGWNGSPARQASRTGADSWAR